MRRITTINRQFVADVIEGRKTQFRSIIPGAPTYTEEYARQWHVNALQPRWPSREFTIWDGPWHGQTCRFIGEAKWAPGDRIELFWAVIQVESCTIQRLRDICLADLWAEGFPSDMDRLDQSLEHRADETRDTYRRFAAFWDEIHGEGAWQRNDWVEAVTFKAVDA